VPEDQQELGHARRRELGEPQVLDHDDAVASVERLRDDERGVRVLRRVRAVAPRVAAGQRNPVRDEPVGERRVGPGSPAA
jgi:hypothetical protein